MSIALITGGSRGLGRSMAEHLAQHGHDIIITYHSNAEAAGEVVEAIAQKGRKAVALQLDTGKAATFEDFARTLSDTLRAEWQRSDFDILVNNAGMGIHAPFMETSEAQFDTLMSVHLKGPFLLSQTLLPMMADGGHIVNISSGLARFSLPGYSAYAIMKGGVEVMTRYMARELGERNIHVNTLAPGAIETDFGGGAVRDNKELNAFVADITALGRAGLPEDIGRAVTALVSGDLDWVNGQRIEASGGMFL